MSNTFHIVKSKDEQKCYVSMLEMIHQTEIDDATIKLIYIRGSTEVIIMVVAAVTIIIIVNITT